MKLTKQHLNQIIQEELTKMMAETNRFLAYDTRDPDETRSTWRADYDGALQEFETICDQAAELFKQNPDAVEAAWAQAYVNSSYAGNKASPSTASIIGKSIQKHLE